MLRVAALAIALIALAPASALAMAGGVDSSFYFPPVGCGGPEGEGLGCHTGVANPELSVTVDGPLAIDPGTGGSGAYSASIPPGFQGLLGAGVNVLIGSESTSDCQLDNLGSPILQPVGPELLTHVGDSSPPQNLVGVWSYDFLIVNCSIPGTVVLYAAMNAFDGSGDETGEVWNRTQLTVTVPEPDASALGLAAAGALVALRPRRLRRR